VTLRLVLGYVLSISGGIILFTSGLGILRMPDVWNRLHAGTKATTLGSILFLAGMGCFKPGWIPKLLLILMFIVLTNPVSGHALARAVHLRREDRPDNLERDDLETESSAEEIHRGEDAE
jgi:multicomponent Na+:H+ antiporter subunit G